MRTHDGCQGIRWDSPTLQVSISTSETTRSTLSIHQVYCLDSAMDISADGQDGPIVLQALVRINQLIVSMQHVKNMIVAKKPGGAAIHITSSCAHTGYALLPSTPPGPVVSKIIQTLVIKQSALQPHERPPLSFAHFQGAQLGPVRICLKARRFQSLRLP